MPIWLTISIGLTGSIVGAVVGNAISHDNGYLVSFLSFGIAIALVASYRRFVQKRPIWGPGALVFPERGLGVEQQRTRLQKLGVDPDALRPDPKQLERARLEAMLQELIGRACWTTRSWLRSVRRSRSGSSVPFRRPRRRTRSLTCSSSD